MRLVLTVAIVALASPVAALPRWAPQPDTAVTSVQNRFLPNLFGGKNNEGQSSQPDVELRIQQLESQVRMLTGQVEELTFTVRRLQSMLESGNAGGSLGQRGSLQPSQGPGAPPQTLGSQAGQAAPPAQAGLGNGPVNLSALNGNLSATPAPSQNSPAARNAAPASNPELDKVRDLQASGRYAMAAAAARSVLVDNPSGPVAGEARYLLGEALLAQSDFRGAANQFLETYTNDPNGARAPESLLKLSTSLNGLGEKEAACSSLEELFGAYPNVTGSLRAKAEAERRTANCA